MPTAGERSRLLCAAAEEAWGEASTEEAAALAAEAALAVEDATREASVPALQAAAVLSLLEETGQDALAATTLDALLVHAEDAPGDLSVASLCALTQALEARGVSGVARARTTLFERISRTEDPEHRARQLLDWLERAWPPQAH